MDKHLFDEAIGEVPPSTFDVAGLVTRGRRAVWLHRVVNPAVAAAVAVVLLTGAVAFTMTGSQDGGLGVGDRPATPVTSPASSSGSGSQSAPATSATTARRKPVQACSRNDLESPAEAGARLSGVVKAVVQAQRPDLRFVPNPNVEYPDGVQQAPLEVFQVTGETPVDRPICDEESYFMAGATTAGVEGEGNILVVLQPDFFDPPDWERECTAGGELTFCQQVRGPNGESVRKQTLALEGGTTQHRVDIDRPDGTEVMVSVEDIADTVKTGGPPTASALPLTLDQLITIGTHPGMTLFP